MVKTENIAFCSGFLNCTVWISTELLQRQLALNTTLFQNGCTSHTFVIAYFQLQMDDLHPH